MYGDVSGRRRGCNKNIFTKLFEKLNWKISTIILKQQYSTKTILSSFSHHPQYSLETIFTSQHEFSELNKKKRWESVKYIFDLLI